jgi:thiamine-monophosphate kinase
MNTKFTEIKELGEFGLIEHISNKIVITRNSTLKGIGDDAAVVDYAGRITLFSTDILLQGIHFDLTYTPIKHLGYKSIIASLSDICAMNAEAEHVLVSLGISNQFSVEMIDELYDGMLAACAKYQVDLIGGDISSSQQGLIINVLAAGTVCDQEDIVYRKGAKEQDLICVSGDLGAAYAGLLVLEREKKVFLENPETQPDLKGFDYILQRQLKPEARKDVVDTLRELQIKPSSMIDISDGLSSELLHICKQSQVGCKIFEDKIPIDKETYNTALAFHIDPLTCVLNGGEDYELLFTIDQKYYEVLKNHPDFSFIGHISSDPGQHLLISKAGNEYPLQAQGWKSL